MYLLKELLFILAISSYSLGSEVELNLSRASVDSFDVVKFETGPALTTRITPKDGIYVNKVLDIFDNVWTPLSKDFTLKSFEIHQRSGHNDLGHLVVSEPSQFLDEFEDTNKDNLNTTARSVLRNLSNLFFAKRDNVWYPLTQYHFDVLKDEMSSSESTLDLDNFTDINVMITSFNSVTKYYLLARRLSHIVRVDYKGEMLWSSSNKEQFKSAYLSYNKQNDLVLVKMTLSTPNLTYDPFDTKSTRYYVETTIFFSKMDGSSWKRVANDQYEKELELLLKNFKEDASRSVKATLDLSQKLVNEFELNLSHFNNKGIEVSVYKAHTGYKLNLVKDDLYLLWASDDPKVVCEDAYLYNLGNDTLVLDLKIGPQNPSYKFFKKENGAWVSLSMDNYKHHLHTSEISLPLNLNNLDYEFLTKTAYKQDGVPVTEISVSKGYYFHQVNHSDETLWDGVRFQRCTKVFQFNSAGYEFLSLLVEDPLTGKSHSVYYERKEKGWVEISEAFYSSLFFTVQLKLSFEFNLEDYLMNNFFLNNLTEKSTDDLSENSEKSEKYFTRSLYQFRGVPMVAITPKFDYNLAKVTEGSEVIWTRAKGYNTISLSFNAAAQPTFLRVSCSDNYNPMFLTYFLRKDGQWVEALYEDYYKRLNDLANVQNETYFTFNMKNIVPSNKYILDLAHESCTMAKVVPTNRYYLNKFVDGTETLWQDTDNKNGKGFEEFLAARFLPYKDPKFVVLTSITQDLDILFNYFMKNESDPNNPKWEKLEYDEFYPKMDDYILECGRKEEVVDLADVYKGLKRDYYTLQDSKFFSLENFGFLTFKERVENLSLYVRGIKLCSFLNSDFVKEVVFVPSNYPKCIRVVFVDKGKENKKYFVKDAMGYKPCDESEYMKEFFNYSNKKHKVHLDLKYYYNLVEEFNKSFISFETSGTLTSFVSAKLNEKYPVNQTSSDSNEFVWGVYNFHNTEIVTLELSPRHILSRITDGETNVTTCQYSEYVKLYFNLTGDNYMALYHRTYDSKDLKLLKFRSIADGWSLVMGSHTSKLDVLLNFASKPVTVDLFHLTLPNSLNQRSYDLSTYETFTYNINSQIVKPGYMLTQLYYNSHLLYDTRNGFAKKYNFVNTLETIETVEFYPKIRPRVIHLAIRSNNLHYNRYYFVESTRPTDGTKPVTDVKSINVFDYYKYLADFGKADEFALDVSVSSSTDDYTLLTELVYNCEYLLVTPQLDRYMVLLTQGNNVIWEADNDKVTKVLLYPKHEPALVMVYYTKDKTANNSHSGPLFVKRFKYFGSVKKWLEVSEDLALDVMKMSKENLIPFNLDLDTLSTSKRIPGSTVFFGKYYTLDRKNLYGLLFTVVKPTHRYDLAKIKHNGQVLFNIHDTTNATDEETSFDEATGSGNRVVNFVFGPDNNYKLLRVTYLKNFTVMDSYFRKNDANSWEEVTSPEFGRALWLVKRFSLVPVVLNVDTPNPLLFSTVSDSLSSNSGLTRILPNDKYHITRVVFNANSAGSQDSENEENTETEPKESEDENKEVETRFLFGSDDVSVLYVEATKYEPRLLRLYYTQNTDLLQVNKEHFAFRNNEFQRVSQPEFEKLLSLSRTLSNLVTYNLDPFYRTYFHPSLTAPKYLTRRYKEVRETVITDSVNFVFPRKGYDIDKLVVKDKTLWKSAVDEEGLLLVTYPPKQPVRAMVKFKNTLKKTIGVQYFDYNSGTNESGEVVGWVEGYRSENEYLDYDSKINKFQYELSDNRVVDYADKFTYLKDGVYTSLVLPKPGVKLTAIFDGYHRVWAPKVNNYASDKLTENVGEEELVKFYFAPANQPRLLVVEYKDFDGVVRLKDFKKVNSDWKEANSEFVSLYKKMLESSYILDVTKPLDEDKLSVSTFTTRGFKVVTVSPKGDTDIVSVVASEADNSNYPYTGKTEFVEKEIWSSSFTKKCFTVQFAPEVNPKVVLLTHSNHYSYISSKFFYKDPVNGWTLSEKSNYVLFTRKLLELENSFVYNLRDKPTTPNENYHYELTDIFGAKFAAISPRHKKKMVGINDYWRYLYDRKHGEELVDLLVSPPDDPHFAAVAIRDTQGELTEKYFKKDTSWIETDYKMFLEQLRDHFTNKKPTTNNKSVSLNELHEKVLSKLTKYHTSEDESEESKPEDTVLSPFTLDLNDVTKPKDSADEKPEESEDKFSKKTYVESTIERTVLKVKGDNLLKELRQGEDVVWKLETDKPTEPKDTENTEENKPKDTEQVNKSDWVVTHLYFAPSDDPKVVTLFFKESMVGPRSLRFVKHQGLWIKDVHVNKDLTNEMALLSLTDNDVLDIERESIRYGNEQLFKKVIVADNLTYFMDIQAREGTPNKIVKVVDGDSLVWDKVTGQEFVSARVYPLLKPKFAKLTVKVGDTLEHKYFRKYKQLWFSLLEKGFETALERYFKHLSTDFESVNLSRPNKYSKDTLKYASFYRTLHKVHFRSLTPINDYKISDVHFTVGGNDDDDDDYYNELSGDGDESELEKRKLNPPAEKTVVFETTSNEHIQMVSYAPADDPKFLVVYYSSTATLLQPNLQPYFNGTRESIEWAPTIALSSDYSYFSGVPSNVFDKHDQEITGPFYPSPETNYYYKDGDKWLMTSDATFKDLCLKHADEMLKRTTPFDVDLERLDVNDDKFTLSTVDIAGAFFTNLTPKQGFSLSHVYQYNKVVHREGSFPIVSLSFFPRSSPRFLKIAHQMSDTLVNNYYFVSYQNVGLLQRDYMAFKSELYDFLNKNKKKKDPLSQFEDAEEETQTPENKPEEPKDSENKGHTYEEFTRDLLNAESTEESSTRKLLLVGHTDKTFVAKMGERTVTLTPGNKFLYYVDYAKNTTSAYSYNYGTNSVEFKDAFKTFSGYMYKMNYYLVVPTSAFVTNKLFYGTHFLFGAEEGHKLVALAMVPKKNPRCLMVHQMSSSGYKHYQLYFLHKGNWVKPKHSLLRYKLKNIVNYHLSAVFPDYLLQESQPLSDKLEEVVEDAVNEGFQEVVEKKPKTPENKPEEPKEQEETKPEEPKDKEEEEEDSGLYRGRYVKPLKKSHYVQRQLNKYFKVPFKPTDDKYLLHGHFEHPEVKDKFEFTYDALKNSPNTSVDFLSDKVNKYMSSDLKFYFEDEDDYKLLLVDEPHYKLNKLTFNGLTVFDTEDVLAYNNKEDGFTYDLSAHNVNSTEYHLEENKFEDYNYTLVRVSEGSRLKKVVDGNLTVWDATDKVVKRFVYYPQENPNRFFVSYLDDNKSEEKYEYLYKDGKWFTFEEANRLELTSTHPFFSSKRTEKPVRLLKGVLLSPPYDPSKAHVLYTENNLDKYSSFVKVSNGRAEHWMSFKPSMSESVSMRIKFVTATLRSNSVVFTGTHPHAKDLNTGLITYVTSKLIRDTLSTHKWFFSYNPDKGHFVYLPIANFKLTKVSFGKHDLFKYDLHAKDITSVYLTTDSANLPEGENSSFRVENVTKVTVLVTDLDNKGRRFTWRRTQDNKWVRASLTTDEVNALFNHVNQAKELSPGPSANLSTFDRTFDNFLYHTDNEKKSRRRPEESEESYESSRLYLSGNVTRLSPGVRTTTFFNYYLDNNEMDVFVTPLKTKFFNFRSEENWIDFKVVVVPEGYNATLLRTLDSVLFDARKGYVDNQGATNSTTGDENVINAVYLTPAVNPYRVYLCMTNKYGDRTFKFYKRSDLNKLEDLADGKPETPTEEENKKRWVESSMTEFHLDLVRNRMETAMEKSTSLRLVCYQHDLKVHYTGSSLQTYKDLRNFDYYVDTDSLFSNVAYKSVYTFVDEKDDYKVLVPFKNNRVSHVTFGSETLFTLKSQFHTVRALLLTPAKNPTSVVVYYVDDKGTNFYDTYNKYLPVSYITDTEFPSQQSTRARNDYLQQESLFQKNKNKWYYRTFLFGDTYGSVKKIHTGLNEFVTKFPHLALDDRESEDKSDRTKYNLDVYLSGVYTPSDSSNKSYDFVYYYDSARQDSVTVFDNDSLREMKGAFSVVVKDSRYTSYLYLRPSLSGLSVKSVVSGDQEVLSLTEDSSLLSLTLSPFREPRTMMASVRDSKGQELYYYMVKKNGKWTLPGTDFPEYLKMKMYMLTASDELNAALPTKPESRPSYNLELRLSGLYGRGKDPNATFVYSYDPSRKDTVTVFDNDTMYEKTGAFDALLETEKFDYLLLRPHLPTYVVTSVVYGSEQLLSVDEQSLLKYVLVSPHDDPTFAVVHVTDAGSDNYLFYYKVNNRWVRPAGSNADVPQLHTLMNKHAQEKLNELDNPLKNLKSVNKDYVHVYLSGLYYTKNSESKPVSRNFVYYYDPRHRDVAYVFEGSAVLEKRGAFNVHVDHSNKLNYVVVSPSAPEFVVDHVFADGQQVHFFNCNSKFQSLTWSSVSDPNTIVLSTEERESKFDTEYYDYTFEKLADKWTLRLMDPKHYGRMKELTNNALALMSLSGVRNVEPGRNLDLFLTGEYWLRLPTTHELRTNRFVWFYDPYLKDSAYVLDQEKVVRKSGAFEVHSNYKPLDNSLFLRPASPEFQVFTVSTSDKVLLQTDLSTYFVSMTLAPLTNPTALLLETVNVQREFKFHYFNKKDGKWVEVEYDTLEKKSMIKHAEHLRSLAKGQTPENKPKEPKETKPENVTCTKFYFDMNKYDEKNEHYSVKRASYKGHDYVLVKVHDHSLLQRLTDGNLLVWNNFHGLRVVKFGFLPPESPAHAFLESYHAGKHFRRFFYKLGGEWDEYYNYSSVPEVLTHMSYQAFSEFTLDLSAYNQSGSDYFLKFVDIFNYKLAFGVVTQTSKLVKVVDGKQNVWANDGYQMVFAFAYFPNRSPNSFGLAFVQGTNSVSYNLFQKSPNGEWRPFFAMDSLRRAMLTPLLNFSEFVSEFSDFALDLSVDNNDNDHYSLTLLTLFGEELMLGVVSKNSNLVKVVDGYLDVWTNDGNKKATRFAYTPVVNPTHFAVSLLDETSAFSLFFSKQDDTWRQDPETSKPGLLAALEQHDGELKDKEHELDSQESTDAGDEFSSSDSPSDSKFKKSKLKRKPEFTLVNEVVFDLHFDMKNDFYKIRYNNELYLYRNFVFNSFVPKQGISVSEVGDAFTPVYNKLKGETIQRISMYPLENPDLLMVQVSLVSNVYFTYSYTITRKFVKVDNKWVLSQDRFDERLKQYLAKEPSLKPFDLDEFLKEYHSEKTEFEGFDVSKDTLSNSVQVLLVGPKDKNKVSKVMSGDQLVWVAKEKSEFLQTCFLLPEEDPELMTLLSTHDGAKYYRKNKLDNKWSKVDEATFEYLSTHLSGSANKLELSHLAEFEDSNEQVKFPEVSNFSKGYALNIKSTKTRYTFLHTGMMKSNDLLFGFVSAKKDVTNNLTSVAFRGENVYRFADNEKLFHVLYFPFPNPRFLAITTKVTYVNDGTPKAVQIKRYFVKNAFKSKKSLWTEVDREHADNLFNLIRFTSQSSPSTIATTQLRYDPTQIQPLKEFVFDLKLHTESKEGFFLKKLSKKNHYYFMLVSSGYRLAKVYDLDLLVYEPNDNHVLDLYYTLDPQFTALSVKYVSFNQKTNSNMLGFVSFVKEGNTWVKQFEFKHKPTKLDHLLAKFDVKNESSETEKRTTELPDLPVDFVGETAPKDEDKPEETEESTEPKEFVFDLSSERRTTEAFNMSRVSSIGDDFSVEVNSGYRLTKLVDKDQVLFETPENTLVNSLYYTPALNPVHLTAKLSTVSEGKPLLLYSYFHKTDGEWRRMRLFSVSPTQDKFKKSLNKTIKVRAQVLDKLDEKTQKKPVRTVDRTTLNTDLDLSNEIRYTDKDGSLYPDEEVSTTSEGVVTKTTLKPVVFDFSVNKESSEGFTVVSSSDYYSSVQFSRGYRLTKLVDGNELIYEPRPLETVTSIYFTPRETPDYLTLRSTEQTSDDSRRVVYLYLRKQDGKWTTRSTALVPEFVEVSLDDKEFELNVNNLVEDEAYTMHRSLLSLDPYSSLNVKEGYKVTKIVDGDLLVYQPESNEKITVVYCEPPKKPDQLTVWYTTTIDNSNSVPLTTYVHLQKTNGKWELTVPKRKFTQYAKPLHSLNEFVLDLAKDRASGPNFDFNVETVDGVDLATVWPKQTARLVKVVYSTYFVWAPSSKETCTRVLFAPLPDPTAAAVVYRSDDPNASDTVKYFLRAEDGTWNETDPDTYVKHLFRTKSLDANQHKLNFSDAANNLMANLGLNLGSLLSGSRKVDLKAEASIYTYPVPKSVTVTSLYDNNQLVHKSHMEEVVSLQLYANATDMFLKATTDLFDNKTSHFYRTTFLTPSELSYFLRSSPQNDPDKPVSCAEFDFDLAVEHHCTKQYSVRHTKFYGHNVVLVTVKEHNKLGTLLDGDLTVWKQHKHKYAVRFGYLPPNRPTHLCLGVYHLKDHKVKYNFLYKEDGKWKHYTSFDNVPSGLLNAPKALEASNVFLDLSKTKENTNDYIVEVENYLDVSYTLVTFNEYSNLTSAVDGYLDVWTNDGNKNVQKVLFYPASKPDHFLVMYYNSENPTVPMYDYVDRKAEVWFQVKYPRHPKLFERTLRAPRTQAVFPAMFELTNEFSPGTLVAGCSKFEFDLSADNHCTKNYSVRHKKYNGYEYVLVKVHKYSKLTRLLDRDFTVWKNDGHQFVLKLAYLPPKNPTEVYMNAYCLKGHVTYRKFFYKLGGKWHEHPHRSKSYLAPLLRELDATHFDFNLSEYNQNFVHFKEFVNHKNFNLVEVDQGNKLHSVYDANTLVWRNPGTKNVTKFLYYPSDKPKHLAVAFYRDDETLKENEQPKLLFEYLNKVNDKWEHETVPQPIVKTLEEFSSKDSEDLVLKLVRKWRKVEPAEFYNNFLHMSVVKHTADFNINALPDEGVYEVKEGFEFEQPLRICNPFPGTHVSNVLEENTAIWKATEPNQHAKSIMLVYEFKSAKENITYEPKLLQLYVKNRDRIEVKYFNKTAGSTNRTWEEIDAKLYAKIYNYLADSDLKNKFFEHRRKLKSETTSTDAGDELSLSDSLSDSDHVDSPKKRLEDVFKSAHVEEKPEGPADEKKEETEPTEQEKKDESKQYSVMNLKDKRFFNFDLSSYTSLSPHYKSKKIMILDEKHMFVALNLNSRLRYMTDNERYLVHFPLQSDCRGFSFYPAVKPTELLAVFRSPEDKKFVKQFKKVNDQWELVSDTANSIRFSKVLINLDIHIATTELRDYKKLNEEKLAEAEKEKEELTPHLLLTTKYKHTDSNTKVSDFRRFVYNLSKTTKQFGLSVYEVNELEKIYLPLLDHHVVNVKLGDFVFYEDKMSHMRVVSVTTVLGSDKKLTTVIVTLTDEKLLTHLAYTLDSGVWVSYHLFPTESTQLSDNIQYAQNKQYSDTFTQKYFN